MPPLALVALGVLATIGLLVCSAFFSSTEIAIFSLQPDWVDDRAATGEQAAVMLAELRANPHRLLVTLLVGNTVVNIAISSIVTAILMDVVPSGSAVVVATLVASLAILVFGEIVPKAYGLGNAASWSLAVARPVRLLQRAISPAVTVLEALTRLVATPLRTDADIETPYLD